MARKKVPPETIIIDDRIDERAMTAEERQKAMKSMIDTVSAQSKAIKASISLSDIASRLPEQLEMQLDFPDDSDKKEDSPVEPKSISLARGTGAITSLGGHVATIADKYLQYSFTSRNMMDLPGEHDNFMFDNAGKLMEYSLNGQELKPLDEIHTAFLMALLQVANVCDIREYNSKDNPSLALHLPSFFRETDVDPRPHERELDSTTGRKKLIKRQTTDETALKHLRLAKFKEFMEPLDNRVGIIPGEGHYTVARFISWDEKTDTAIIAIPYEIKLAELARLHSDRHSAISTIFRANIVTENWSAVELANRIAVGVIERGVTRSQIDTYKSGNDRKPIKKKTTKTAPDGSKEVEELTFAPEQPEKVITKERTNDEGITTKVQYTDPKPRIFSYSVRFDTLIADCPQLKAEIEAIRKSPGENKSQRINKKLKDVFAAAIRIIMEKSEMPRYYANLAITTGKLDTFKAPTNSTLSEKLVVTHKGKNPQYSD